MDLAMTGRDGLGWLREMRSLSGHENTPVVVVTSKDYAQDRILAKELGALDTVNPKITRDSGTYLPTR